ncbi:MAG: NADH-quinone oxidoreductase subunit NuoE, partial [Pseudomonadota bacterium]
MQKQDLLTAEVKKGIDHWVAKFPAEQKQSAVIPGLLLVQEANGGWLSDELLGAVADYLEMPKIAVFEVATFYTMFDLKPVGKHKIFVCTNISCMLRGCDKIVDHLKQKLAVDFGQTTKDGKFTLKEVECMAACTTAPMMQIDKDYHENLTVEKVDEILDSL